MIWVVLIAGFSLGLIGSVHCIGMCGPIAISIPVSHLSPINRNVSLLVYNLGRTITYALLGLIFGFFGQAISLAGFQQMLSVFLGVFILFTVFVHYSQQKLFQPAFIKCFHQWVQSTISNLLKSSSRFGYLSLGMVNGLLPCGMVYIALAAALNYKDSIRGTFFMTMFGLGTIPLMITFSLFGFVVSLPVRNKIKKHLPLISVFIGLLFIFRGLGTGLNSYSPQLKLIFEQVTHCF
ncbi:MAG: sulfite exporter TauE/SafE family protein [Chitinophagaceae bacterium]